MAGLAQGLAHGLEAGFEIGRKIDQDKERKAQTVLSNTRLATQDARQVKQDDRQAKLDELKLAHDQYRAASDELGEYASEGTSIAQQYGGAEKIPPEVQAEYATRLAPIKSRRDALRQKFLPAAEYMQEGLDTAARMKAGQVDPMDPKVPTKQVFQALVATTGMLPARFKPGPKGEPSEMLQATSDFRAGLEGQNEGLALKAINKLAEPELSIGVGDPSPHGGVIEGKQIIKILPAPPGGPEGNDPNAGKVGVVLRVFVRQSDPNAGVAETRQAQNIERERYGGPPGATGHYDTTVTQNRSTDPADPVALIDMSKALERIAKIETLATAFSNPEFAARVAAGEKEDGGAADVFLRAHRAAGGKMPPPKMPVVETVKNTEFGSTRIERDPATGKEIGRTVVGATGVAPTGPLGKKLADIKAADLSDADKAKAARVAAGVEKVKAGGGGGGDGGGGAAVGGGSVGGGAKDEVTVDFWAQAVIAGDRDWQIGLARSKGGSSLIEAVKRRVPHMAKELGLTPQDIGTTRAQQAALTKTMADRQKYVTSVEQLNDTLDRQLNLVESLIPKGAARGGFLNTPVQKIRSFLRDEDVAALRTAITGAAREHQRVLTSPMSNAQLHVAAQETADKLLNENQTVGEMLAVMNVMRTEARNGKEAGHAALKSVRDGMKGLGKGEAPATSTPAGKAVSADDEALINKYLKPKPK